MGNELRFSLSEPCNALVKGATFDNLNRFDRMTNVIWFGRRKDMQTDFAKCGYTRTGMRSFRRIHDVNANSESCTYDGLDRLTRAVRGAMPAGRSTVKAGTEKLAQQ